MNLVFDLQVNGLNTKDFGCDFWKAPEPESIASLLEYLKKEGVERILATLITDSKENIEAQLKAIQNYIKECGNDNSKTQIAGVHIEGGLISRMGVHPEKYASELNYQNAKSLVQDFPRLIKLWTLCPRKDENGELTRLLQDSDIEVSYGHSEASYEEAMNAFDKYKVRLVTHWGNAMYLAEGFKQRNCRDEDLSMLDELKDLDKAGIGLAAYRHPEVYTMAIAGSEEDGDLHLDPRLLKKLAEAKKNKFILVSDSVAYSGPKPETLVGGLTSLAKHVDNAREAGLAEEIIQSAVQPKLIVMD